MDTKAFFVILIFLISGTQGRTLSKRAAFYIANETACVVDNTVYYNGDPIPTDDPCEACKCRPPGFACVLKDCEVKPGCRAVRRAGHCCPDYICGCEHNGRMYRDGDEIRDTQNPCYTCHCQGSAIACAFVDCFFRVDCAPEYITGECCPRYDHCESTDSTPNATSSTLPALVSKIITTASAVTESGTSSYSQSVPETTTLAANEEIFKHVSLEITTESETYAPTTTVDQQTTESSSAAEKEKRTEAPNISTLEYAIPKSPDEQESSLGEREQSEEKTTDHTETTEKPDETSSGEVAIINSGSLEAEHTESTRSDVEANTEPFEKVTTTHGEVKESGNQSHLPEDAKAETPEERHEITKSEDIQISEDKPIQPVEIKNEYDGLYPYFQGVERKTSVADLLSTESTAAQENDEEFPEKLPEKTEDSNVRFKSGSLEHAADTTSESTVIPQREVGSTTKSDSEGQEQQYSFSTKLGEQSEGGNGITSSSIETTTLKIPIPLVYLHYNNADENKEIKPDDNNNIDPEKHEEELPQPDTHDSTTREVLITTPLPEGNNLLSVKNHLDTEAKAEGEADAGSETADKEETDDKGKENDLGRKKDVDRKEFKQDRGLKTESESSDDNKKQETELQDITPSTLDAQQVSTPATIKTIAKGTGEENEKDKSKQETLDAEDDNSKQDRSVKTKTTGENGAQNQQQHDERISTQATFQEQQQQQSLSLSQNSESQQSLPPPQNSEQESLPPSQNSELQESLPPSQNSEQQSLPPSQNSEKQSSPPSQNSEQQSLPPSQNSESQQSFPPAQSSESQEVIKEQAQELQNIDTATGSPGERDQQSDAKEDRSVKTASSGAIEKEPQKTELPYDITLPSIQSSLDKEKQPATTSQITKSQEEINREQQDSPSGEAINPKDKIQQDDTKYKTSIKTASNTRLQEAEKKADAVYTTVQIISGEDKLSTPAPQNIQATDILDENKHQSPDTQKVVIGEQKNEDNDSKKDRSVKTSSKSGAQETVQQESATQSILGEQQLTTPTSQNIKSGEKYNEEPKFPSWEEIGHKNQDDESTSRKDKSIKSANDNATDTETQKRDKQDSVTSFSQEATVRDNDQSTASPSSTTVESSADEEKQEAENKKGDTDSKEKFKNKEDSVQNLQSEILKTVDSVGIKDETIGSVQQIETTQLPVEVTSREDHQSMISEENLSAEQSDSKQDRSVKTGSKGESETQAQETVLQDNTRLPSTAAILDQELLSTPKPQNTKSQVNNEKQFTPSPQEISHQSVKNSQTSSVDSKKDRSVKVGSDTEKQRAPQEEDESPSLEATVNSDKPRPTEENPKSIGNSDEQEAIVSIKDITYNAEEQDSTKSVTEDDSKQDQSVKIYSKSVNKAAVQESTQIDDLKRPATEIVLDEQQSTSPTSQETKSAENAADEQSDSKKDRSVKTANKSTSKTGTQEIIKQEDVIVPSTQITLDEQELTTPAYKNIKSKENYSGGERFPSWEEINHKSEEIDNHSRRSRSVKIASNSAVAAKTQKEQIHIPSPSPDTTADYQEPSTPTFQSIKTKSSINEQKQESQNTQEIVYKPTENEKDNVQQEDSKQDRSVKTAGKTEAQETVKQDEVRPTVTHEKIFGAEEQNTKSVQQESVIPTSSEEPKFPSWEEINHKFEAKSIHSGSERSIKTQINAEPQQAEQIYISSPSPDTTLVHQEPTTPTFQSIKSKSNVNEQKQESQDTKGIGYKPAENEKDVQQEDTKQDRSVKTANKTQVQETVKQDDIRPPVADEQIFEPQLQNTKSEEKVSEEPKFPSWEEINHKYDPSDILSNFDRSIKTSGKRPVDAEPQKEEQNHDIPSPSQETTVDYQQQSTPAFQNVKSKSSANEQKQESPNIKGIIYKPTENGDLQEEDSKQDRSVKTVSKPAEETAKQDQVEASSTERFSDKQVLDAELQKTKYDGHSNGEQSFPSWEEINYKSEGTETHSRRSRSVKTASSNAGDTEQKNNQNTDISIPQEPQKQDQYADVTLPPESQKEQQYADVTYPPQRTTTEDKQSTHAFQITDSKGSDSVIQTQQESANIKGVIHRAEQEEQDSFAQSDSKQDRSVKTVTQASVIQAGIIPSSAESFLDGQVFEPEPQNTKSKEQINEDSKFPSWDEIHHKSDIEESHSSWHRSINTEINTAGDGEPQKPEQQDDVTSPSPQTTVDHDESNHGFQNTKSKTSVNEGKQESVQITGDASASKETKVDSDEQNDSKQDRSVKTASKTVTKTEVQDEVRQHNVRPSPTAESVPKEQAFNPEFQKQEPNEKIKEDAGFPSWEEINYKYEGTSSHSRRQRSVKTANNSASDAERQKAEQIEGFTPPTPETTAGYEPSTHEIGAQNLNDGTQQQQQQNANIKGVFYEPENRSVKTVSKAEAQEIVNEHKTRPSSLENTSQSEQINSESENTKDKVLNGGQQSFPSWEEINLRSQSGQAPNDAKLERSVKTAVNGPSDAKVQQADQQDITPVTVLDNTEQSVPSQSSTGHVDEDNQQIVINKRITHKTVQYENKDDTRQENFKHDRSVKTASKTGAQETVSQDEIRTSTKIILDQQELSTPSSIKTKSTQKQEEQSFPSWEEINHKSGSIDHIDENPRHDKGVKTVGSRVSDRVTQKPEQQIINSPSPKTNLDDYEPSTPASQNIKSKGSSGNRGNVQIPTEDSVRQSDSRKGRGVKTIVQSTSNTQNHDDIRLASTEPVSVAQQQVTPESQNTKFNDKESGQQEFPRWEEIIHKSEGNYHRSSDEQEDTKQERSVKTTNKKGSQNEKNSEQDALTLPPASQEVNTEEVFISTLAPQATVFEDQEQQRIPSKKGGSYISDDRSQVASQDSEKSDSIKHRSIKTSIKGQAETPTEAHKDDIKVPASSTPLEEQISIVPPSQNISDNSNNGKVGSSPAEKQDNQEIGKDIHFQTTTELPLEKDEIQVPSKKSTPQASDGSRIKTVIDAIKPQVIKDEVPSQTSKIGQT